MKGMCVLNKGKYDEIEILKCVFNLTVQLLHNNLIIKCDIIVTQFLTRHSGPCLLEFCAQSVSCVFLCCVL